MKEGSASRTAEYVALFRAIESRRPPAVRLFEDPFAERFLGARLRGVARAAGTAAAGAAITRYIDRRWPGPRLSAVVRTRLIDDAVSAAIGEGARQLVILGAGYDCRAYRLPAAAPVRTFELDHPSTQAQKRRVLEQELGSVPERVTLAPIDFLETSPAAVLEASGLDSTLPAVFVWEGVISYLTIEAVNATLADIARVAAPRSSLVFTYVDSKALAGGGDFPGKEAWLKAVADAGEPFTLGLDPVGEVPALLASHGMDVRFDVETSTAAGDFGLDAPGGFPAIYRVAGARVG